VSRSCFVADLLRPPCGQAVHNCSTRTKARGIGPALAKLGNGTMNSKRILARDRRMAAVHEASHVVVARRFALRMSSAWIVPNEGGESDEKTWIGRVQIESVDKADQLSRRMIGVAGAVAEHLWQRGWIEDVYPDGMSETDWALAGCDPDEPDDLLMDAGEEVGRLFERDGLRWQELLAETRRLIIASRPSA
jgi:hypothetical protein